MADFEKAFALTMGNEGGYANNPADRGGETYKGIARKINPNWSGWHSVDAAKKQTGIDSQLNRILAANSDLQIDVKRFYKLNYWDVNKLDQINDQQIAEELFDTAVNCGTRTAAMMLQESLNVLNLVGKSYPNVSIDGLIGPETIAAVNSHPKPKSVLKVLNGLQFERYIEIIRKDEGQEVFINSWLSRVVMAA